MMDYFDIDDMFSRMKDTFKEMQRIGLPFVSSGMFPVDLEDRGDKLVLKADLPGVEKKDIKVKTTPTEVMIAAGGSQEIERVGENFYRKERRSRRFQRVLSLPEEIDPAGTRAKYENGVLTVNMKKRSGRKKWDVKIE